MTSIRDLVKGEHTPILSTPALSMSANASIEDAAHMMSESGKHHLVIVGSDGRALGMISSLDVIRALIGMPAHYPKTFPHRDAELELCWSNVEPFDGDHVREAPVGAGVVVFSVGGRGQMETDRWAESSLALRARLMNLVRVPPRDESPLASLLAGEVRFRCACLTSATERERAVRRLRDRMNSARLG